MEHYWYIVRKDGERIRVKPKPESIAFIKQRLKDGLGHIITRTQTINVFDVKEFYESDEPVVETERLLGSGNVEEDAARAFQEPLATDVGIICRAVKRRVTRRRWDSYFSRHENYRLLEEGDSHVTIGYWLPTHLVDLHIHELCSDEEKSRLKQYTNVNDY